VAVIRTYRRISVSRWLRELAEHLGDRTDPKSSPGAVEVQRVWNRYITLGRSRTRLLRVLPAALFYWGFGIALCTLFGWPNVPYRGQVAFWVDLVLTQAAWFAVAMMVFWVVDAQRLCRAFVGWLSVPKLGWGSAVAASKAVQRRGLVRQEFASFLPVELVARRTRALGPTLVHPFVVLFLLTIARLRVFDDWSWPASASVYFLLLMALTVVAGLRLRLRAERLRRECLHRLRVRWMGALGAPEPSAATKGRSRPTGRKASADKLSRLVEELGEIREGAYGPLRENPLLQAVILPFGGVSLVAVIDWMMKLSSAG
jgi:hypothetical protein